MNSKFVTNERGIIKKLSVRMQGQEIQSLSVNIGSFKICNKKAQRSNVSRLQQGCDDQAETENLNLLRSNANAASVTGTNTAIATVFGKNSSQFCTPLLLILYYSTLPS